MYILRNRSRTNKKSSLSPFLFIALFFMYSHLGAIDFTCANPKTFDVATSKENKKVKYNVNGNIKIFGNSILCADNDKNGICTDPGTKRNNDIYMINSDIDTNADTFNSSSSKLTLPENAQVLWAGLYWQGMLKSGTDASKENAGKVKFATPNMPADSYIDVNTSDSSYSFNWVYYTSERFYYQANIDITEEVKTSGSGWYTIANLTTNTGQPNGGSYGAWSIVIVYRDTTASLKNLTVYDGFVGVVTGDDYTNATNYANDNNCASSGVGSEVSIPLSGFLTPQSGTVASTLLMFAGEGDLGSTGDKLSLTDSSNTAINVSNGANPEDDIFNASISTDGVAVDGANFNPYYGSNFLGIDIDTFNVSNIIGNNQSATTVKLNTVGDSYHPGVFAFSTELYEPEVCYFEEIYFDNTKLLVGDNYVNIGEKLNFVVQVKNRGVEDAKGLFVQNPFILQVAYDENTTTYNDVNATDFIHQTDDTLDDFADYNDTEARLQLFIGHDVNASAPSGGTLGHNESISFEYTGHPIGLPENNETEMIYYVSYRNDVLGVTIPPTTMPKCEDFNSTFRIKYNPFDGEFDVVDSQANLGIIKTKIANQTFNVDLIHLNSSASAVSPVSVSVPTPISVEMSDTCEVGSGIFIGGESFAQGESFKTLSIDASKVQKASKRQFFVMSFFSWDDLFTAASFNCHNSNMQANLNGVPQCLNSSSKIESVFAPIGKDIAICISGTNRACDSNSYDNSGTKGFIEPEKYNHDYGCIACLADQLGKFQCSSDDFAIKPNSYEIDTSVLPNPNLLKAGEDYNLSVDAIQFGNNNPTPDYNQTKANLQISVDKRLPDGITIDNTLHGTISFAASNFTFSNGTTSDMGITYDDVGIISIKVSDIDWAAVDSDDTPLADRTITGEANVTFIPHDFNITNINITNELNGNFTYLSSDLNMSAKIPLLLRAQNKQGNNTKNYSDGLFEKNISLNAFIHATAINKDANISSPININLDFTDGNSTLAWNDANVLKFNFERSLTQTIEPFDVNGTELNVTAIDTDHVYGESNQSALGTATFYYGRAHAPDYTFAGDSGTARIYYEVYCKDCNKSNFNISNAESIDSINWYQNLLHVSAAGVANPIPNQVAKFQSFATTTIDPFLNQLLSLKNTTARPFIDQIMLNPPSWLEHYPTNFTVEFLGKGDWAGAGSVSDTNVSGGHTHNTVPNRVNKRLDW
ncbi:MAG: hypothetical protein IBX44_07625 [Sulfurospirillum sp.]|nr:hypothetical protein [Sulfurospirillum sp.]